MPQREAFEYTMERAMSLMLEGRHDEACQFLLEKKIEAIENQERLESALYASVLGSYLVASGRDDLALEAYLEAEQLSDALTQFGPGGPC